LRQITDSVEVYSKANSFHTKACRSESRLNTGMPRTNDRYIILTRFKIHIDIYPWLF